MAYDCCILQLEMIKLQQKIQQCLDITFLAEQMILNINRSYTSGIPEHQQIYIANIKKELTDMKKTVNTLMSDS